VAPGIGQYGAFGAEQVKGRWGWRREDGRQQGRRLPSESLSPLERLQFLAGGLHCLMLLIAELVSGPRQGSLASQS
jgi:hypothetical protein